MAAVDAVPATDGAGGGGATAAVPAPPTLLHAASAICCVAAYKHVSVSSLLAYHATFAVSLLCLARAAWPDRVDAVLRPLGAYARRAARDLEADLRRLRDAARGNALTAPACAWAEDRARRARAAAVAGWRAADGAAWLVLLRLLGRALRLAAGVLLDAAREEAKAQAPSVQEYLRGVARRIRPSPASRKEGGKDYGGLVLEDIVSLVGVGFYLLFSTEFILKSLNAVSGTQFDAACLVAACGLATLAACWIDQPDDDSDETDTTGDRPDATRREGGDAGAGEAAKLEEVQASWQFMRVLVIIAFGVDAFLLHVKLGPRPLELAFLALCNLMVLDIGRQVQLVPDGGEDGSVDAAVGKWRRGAMAVFAASSVKILAIYLVLDFYLAALSFLWLWFMAGFLLAEQDSFFERDEEGVVSGEDHVTGGADAEEGADESRTTEHSNTSSSEDEEEGSALEEQRNGSEEHSSTSSSEDEEEGCTLEEYCGSSEEHDEEEPDCGSGGSTDDGWDLIEVDSEMPDKDSCGSNRKSSKIFPWK